MAFLTFAVTALGALCVLDLVLSLGVIRRLREHTELISNLGGTAPVMEVGQEVGDFAAVTVDGDSVSRIQLTDETLVGFFSPTCRPCRETVAKFVAYARTVPGGRSRVLTVVVGDTDAAAPFAMALREVAQVVVEGAGGPVGAAFDARAYPTVLRVSPDLTGRLLVTANRVALDQPSAVVA